MSLGELFLFLPRVYLSNSIETIARYAVTFSPVFSALTSRQHFITPSELQYAEPMELLLSVSSVPYFSFSVDCVAVDAALLSCSASIIIHCRHKLYTLIVAKAC